MMQSRSVIWWNLQRFFSYKGTGLARELGAGPESGWSRAVYETKLHNIVSVLKAMAVDSPPALIGFAEVEDQTVVKDILNLTGWIHLKEVNEKSPFLSGYDITLLYDDNLFKSAGEPRSHNIHNRYQVRDIFEVPLKTHQGEDLIVLVNHWPSRRWSQSGALRIGLADYCSRLFDRSVKYTMEEMTDHNGVRLPAMEKLLERWNLPIIVMGDFNDEPYDTSIFQVLRCLRNAAEVRRTPRFPAKTSPAAIKRYLSTHPKLYNPSWDLLSEQNNSQRGTLFWSGRWYLLDQVMVSRGLLTENKMRYKDNSLRVFCPPNVPGISGNIVELRKRSLRPFAFDPKQGRGVSDHFPLIFELQLPELP